MTPHVSPFGHLPDGRLVERVELRRAEVAVDILTYGGTVASLRVPDGSGGEVDVVLGFDDLAGWTTDPQYFGSLVGRVANRIAHGRFPLDGRTVDVELGGKEHQLHGGPIGFDKAIWHAEPFEGGSGAGVVLRHTSPDGDQGFPGTVEATVTYTLDDAAGLTIDYEAATDAPTVVNLTNHTYFDLDDAGGILEHEVRIHASAFLPVGEGTIPTGEVRPVDGTPFDFRTPHRVGERIGFDDEQLHLAGGYDHCWVVDGPPGTLRPTARVATEARWMTVETTQPGVQFYSGNGIRPRQGRGGRRLGVHDALCLETQHFPDAPNHPHFPSIRLDPGTTYRERTVYRFGGWHAVDGT